MSNELNETLHKIKLNIKQKPSQEKVDVQSRLLTEVEKDFFRKKFKMSDAKKTGNYIIIGGIVLSVIFLIGSIITILDMPKDKIIGYSVANVFAIAVLLGFCIGIGKWLKKPDHVDSWIIFETTILKVSEHIHREDNITPYRYLTVEWPFTEDKSVKIKTEATYNYSVYDKVYIVCRKLNEYGSPISAYSDAYPLNYRSSIGEKIS